MRLKPLLSIACAVLLSQFLGLGMAVARDLPEFSKLVAENGPAVVNISSKQTLGTVGRLRDFSVPDLPDDNPLQDFFRRFLGEEGEAPDEMPQARSLGSGFIISSDGYVLTNSHVVDASDEIVVRTNDRREFIAKLIGADKRSDIALLKVDASGLPVAKIGSSKNLQVGEWVLAIGSPFGFDSSATAGIVSAKGRSLPSENYVPFIQTDVAINPGNSGGPLFNLDGEVVGVNSQIYSRTGGFMGLSFAIPIEVAMGVVDQLKTQGRVSRGWLGVLIQDVTRELAQTFGMDQPRGALVSQVLAGSPAEAADLQPGDIILSFDGRDVPTSGALPPLVGETHIGATAVLRVLREGKTLEVAVKIEELPDEDKLTGGDSVPESDGRAVNRLGIVVGDLSAEQRQRLGNLQGGVVIDIIETGAAEAAGLADGDVILMFDNKAITDLKGFNQILKGIEAERTVAVLVQRGDSRMFYALRMPKDE